MASKHFKRDEKSRLGAAVMVTFVALAFAAIAAVVVVHGVLGVTVSGQTPPARQAASGPAALQLISQEGRLVAVSPTSVTAESIDGFARTYVIDSQTNAITVEGSRVGGTSSAFAVNDEVAIVGVVRDGTAVATAVADKRVSNLDGPPMDGF